MSANLLTPWDYALMVKCILRAALMLYGVSHAQLARMLGLESAARVDAALSDARDNAVPLWWFAHPGFPSQVRDHVFEELRRRTATEVSSAESPERQIVVALSRVGIFITTASATLTPNLAARISAENAAQLLVVVTSARDALQGLLLRLQQRVTTGSHAAVAKRGQS